MNKHEHKSNELKELINVYWSRSTSSLRLYQGKQIHSLDPHQLTAYIFQHSLENSMINKRNTNTSMTELHLIENDKEKDKSP